MVTPATPTARQAGIGQRPPAPSTSAATISPPRAEEAWPAQKAPGQPAAGPLRIDGSSIGRSASRASGLDVARRRDMTLSRHAPLGLDAVFPGRAPRGMRDARIRIGIGPARGTSHGPCLVIRRRRYACP